MTVYKTMARTALGLLGAVALVAPVTALGEEGTDSDAGKIVVDVMNIENDKGKIGCSIFANEDGFPNDANKALRSTFVKPKDKKASCVFDGIKPGTYAVSVMHDLDNDGELKTSMIGRPKEPWGVSNDAPAEKFGPPKFKAAAFKYTGKGMKLKIKLHL